MLLAAALLAACGNNEDNKSCTGEVTAVAPGPTGTIMVTGDFADGQPILELVGAGGATMAYPATDYTNTTATFTMIPSGMFAVTWSLSCFDDSGQTEIDGPSSATVP